jgi:hypothetical protein
MVRSSQTPAAATDGPAAGRNGKSPAAAEAEGKEKRLIWRLLNYWEQQRGDRDYPALEDIDPAAISEIWPYCFLLDVKNYRAFPYFQYLGPSLAKYSGIFLGGQHDWSFTLLKKAVCHFREALERGAPVLVEEELTQYDNRKLLLRSVLLPLSEDQEAIDHMLGAAHGILRTD